jgi:hypothetical protein
MQATLGERNHPPQGVTLLATFTMKRSLRELGKPDSLPGSLFLLLFNA